MHMKFRMAYTDKDGKVAYRVEEFTLHDAMAILREIAEVGDEIEVKRKERENVAR